MASFGFEVKDAIGNIVFSSDRMADGVKVDGRTCRLWHWEIAQTDGNVLTTVNYPEPLDHEPIVFVCGVGWTGARVHDHLVSGGQYVGVRLVSVIRKVEANIVVVFAKE